MHTCLNSSFIYTVIIVYSMHAYYTKINQIAYILINIALGHCHVTLTGTVAAKSRCGHHPAQ